MRIHWKINEIFTDIGCRSAVIAPEKAALRLPFKCTLWRREGVMRERTLVFNGVNWMVPLILFGEENPCIHLNH